MPIHGFAGTGGDQDGIQYHGGTKIPFSVTIAYAASATTDGIEATFTVTDRAGNTIERIQQLDIWISNDAEG